MSASQVQITSFEEITDPLKQKPQTPDRVFYATGVLLDAEDFKAEQLYHRGRLSRALEYLHGSGTVAGLSVEWVKPLNAGVNPDFPNGREETIQVNPGLALDRLGRIIEVPSSACLRLKRWYEQQEPSELLKAFHPTKPGDPNNVVVVDVFIRFYACERGKTPAFATGPFDALDAVQPSRLREFYKLELVAREENPAPLPANLWPDLSKIKNLDERRKKLHDAIFDAWRESKEGEHKGWDERGPVRLTEDALTPQQDPTSLFLARLKLPAGPPANAGDRPIRKENVDVEVDNSSRRFVYPAPALASWIGI
jgi:hypothetical protein